MRRGALLALIGALGCTPTMPERDAGAEDVAPSHDAADASDRDTTAADAQADADAGALVHDPIAPGVTGPLGTVMPLATAPQRAAFERGRAVFARVRRISDGLGPEYSGVSCEHCHERPTIGGGAGLYRNTYLSGAETEPGVFRLSSFHLESEDTGSSAGVVRLYRIPGAGQPHARSPLPADASRLVARNPTPLYVAGPIGAVEDATILALADPDDADADGISGRPNYELGHVGRYGTQAIAAGLEDFVRVEVFLSLGLTVQLLDADRLAALPFPDRSDPTPIVFVADAADAVADPEMSADELFDLLSFVQLLAGPPLDPLDARSAHGRDVFASLRCDACHRPRMPSPVGPLPLYSDLLLHDMGPALANGLDILEATQSEFRTSALWGIAALGPYLHDGRASTLDEAIRMHGGEATAVRDAYVGASPDERDALLAFLATLGGAALASAGLEPPGTPLPTAGMLGAPRSDLTASELASFVEGRLEFDRMVGPSRGLGSPEFNGDSCRACHFDPVLGGAGALDVNVVRQALDDGTGTLTVPPSGDVAFRERLSGSAVDQPPLDANVQEHRQTPALFGVGLLDLVSDAEILSREDPDDLVVPDGISGRAGRIGGAVGRFGWKASVPHLAEFVREATSVELGLTVPAGSFGASSDGDAVADPEMEAATLARITSFVAGLAAPVRGPIDAIVTRGDGAFARIGCALCHVPSLASARGPVPAFTDLLLHDVASSPTAPGIVEGDASAHEYRTPPLWGIRASAPYMHAGEAETLRDAIALHGGEAAAVRAAFDAASGADRDALIAFLESL